MSVVDIFSPSEEAQCDNDRFEITHSKIYVLKLIRQLYDKRKLLLYI